jgi:hypothetical protein
MGLVIYFTGKSPGRWPNSLFAFGHTQPLLVNHAGPLARQIYRDGSLGRALRHFYIPTTCQAWRWSRMNHNKDEQEKNSNDASEGPRRLPVFEGYTVDERLREFRKVSMEHGFETVPFASRKGQRLLARWVGQQFEASHRAGEVRR